MLTLDTSRHKQRLEEFDLAVRGAQEAILGSPLRPDQWNQASLPVSLGGLGLRQAAKHGAAAYLSSLGASELLVQEIRQNQVPQTPEVGQAMQDLNDQLGDPLTPEEVSNLTQRNLSVLIDTEASSKLTQGTRDIREKARLKCTAREGAGDWLNALPSKSLGLHLRRAEFVTALRYRLGMPVFRQEGQCPMPRCHRVNDILGDHAVSCAVGGERISKHNHVRDALFQAAVQAGLGPSKEPDGLLPGSDDRPADILIPFWTQGKDTAIDVTVVNPLQCALVARSSQDGDSAVAHAYNGKVRFYGERCAREGIAFLPMAVDSFGGWHKAALAALTRLGRQLARTLGGEEKVQVRHLRQRLGVLLARDNVAMICSRTPTFPGAEIDGEDE